MDYEALFAPYTYTFIDNYWSIVVQNRGTKAVQSVSLTLPGPIWVSIRRDGQEQNLTSPARISLGELQPHDVVNVHAWMRSNLQLDKIKLTHSAGIGQVKVYRRVGPAWYWIATNIVVFIVPMIFVLLLVPALIHERQQKESKSKRKTAPRAAAKRRRSR